MIGGGTCHDFGLIQQGGFGQSVQFDPEQRSASGLIVGRRRVIDRIAVSDRQFNRGRVDDDVAQLPPARQHRVDMRSVVIGMMRLGVAGAIQTDIARSVVKAAAGYLSSEDTAIG